MTTVKDRSRESSVADTTLKPFGYMVLAGPSGSGKSRLALEIARRLALQDDELGRPISRTWRDQVRSWWRVQVRCLPWTQADPWDVGLLQPDIEIEGTGLYRLWKARKAVAATTYADQVSAWRPRRPTLLILDDPLLDDASLLIKALSTRRDASDQPKFNHAVRLLIVNQTKPHELEKAGQWRPLRDLLTIGQRGEFAAEEVEALRDCMTARIPADLHSKRGIGAFLHATKGGNPLLVEAAFDELRNGRSVDDLSAERLVSDRVDRVFQALDLADASDPAMLRAFAVATLGQSGAGFPIQKLNAPDDLRRKLPGLFPHEATDLTKFVPAIRPEPIGDSFVRRVFDKTSLIADETEREEMIRLAWIGEPRGTLRSALRLGGRSDDLGTALSKGPPDDGAGLEDLDIAEAYAQVALVVRPPFGDALSEASLDQARGLVHTSLRQMERLKPERAVDVLDALLDMAEGVRAEDAFLSESWLQHVGVALQRYAVAVEPARNGARLVVEIVKRICNIGATRFGWHARRPDAASAFLSGWSAALRMLSESEIGLLTRTLEDLHERAFLAGYFCILIGQPLADFALSGADQGDMTLDLLPAVSAVCRGLDQGRLTALIARAQDRLDDAIPRNLPTSLLEIRFLRALAGIHENDAESCRGFAEQVKTIAAAHAHDIRYQREFADAWATLAFATKDGAECFKCANEVRTVTANFPRDPVILAFIANAFTHVMCVAGEDTALYQVATDIVEETGGTSADSHHVRISRAKAAMRLAFTTRKDPQKSRTHAWNAEAAAEGFPADAEIQGSRGGAWLNVQLGSDDPDFRRDCCERIEAAAIRFPENPHIQHDRAAAWNFLAAAERKDPRGWEEFFDRVKAITDRFPDEYDLQLELAKAMSHMTYATRADRIASESWAERIASLMRKFPSPDMESILADARKVAGTTTSAAPTHAPASRGWRTGQLGQITKEELSR